MTLDPDVEALVRRAMQDRKLSFKQALNEAIRAGLAPAGAPFETPVFPMGDPKIALDKALAVAGRLEDEELVRRLATRK